jgi:F0F1-type ATP synthase assembly protein I
VEIKPPEPTNQIFSTGAIYKPLHVERQVKIYPIQEHELTTIKVLSTALTLSSSAFSGTLVFMLGILWDISSSTDPNMKTMGQVVVGVCALILVGCVAVACWAFFSRKSELEKILSEARPR